MKVVSVVCASGAQGCSIVNTLPETVDILPTPPLKVKESDLYSQGADVTKADLNDLD